MRGVIPAVEGVEEEEEELEDAATADLNCIGAKTRRGRRIR